MRKLIALVALAVMTAGCTYEWHGDALYACGDVIGGDGTVFSGCVDTGQRR